ncbi:DUF1450 domain-containing protein [Effusibacillus consociatus]|uniref:DUF1450 domain-containing protein n=1 Tax=Effusibacillus consociatus TaxID=1117041 RepID=A0ABV9PYU2_9BACL
MAIKKLEYCISNIQNNGTSVVYDTIKQEFPEISQNRWACLGNCSECFKKSFVIIDDKEILAESKPEDLLEKLREKMAALT